MEVTAQPQDGLWKEWIIFISMQVAVNQAGKHYLRLFLRRNDHKQKWVDGDTGEDRAKTAHNFEELYSEHGRLFM